VTPLQNHSHRLPLRTTTVSDLPLRQLSISTDSALNRVHVVKMSYYYALLASAVALWLVYRYANWYRSKAATISRPNEEKKAPEQEDPLRAYQDIEPLHDFDWESTPPMKLRPFKPKYHLTMGKERRQCKLCTSLRR
jgi:hypothetical protein